MSDHDQAEIDALIQRFFAAFDNRNGRMPCIEAITRCFVANGTVARQHAAGCDLFSPEEFARPRVALLTDGSLSGFHEWEDTSSTRVFGTIASRISRYAKSGSLGGEDYSGGGTKLFQLSKSASGWRIIALAWIDDAGVRPS